MKLLFLNRSFPVLSQTFVLDHIAYAVDAGYQTTVAALKLVKGVEHGVVARLQLYETILYSRPLDARNLGRIAKGLARNSTRLSSSFRRTGLGRPTLTETAIAAQLQHAPDVIIANFGPTGLSAVRLKDAYFPTAKVVVVFHGNDVSGYVQKFGWANYQRMAGGVDLAVCVNARWAELLRSETSMTNIAVHHLGVDCNAIKPRTEHRQNKGEVLFVGRMAEKKGFDHLVKAIAALNRNGMDLRVHAVGDGPMLAAYQAMVRGLDLEPVFVFHGPQPHEVVLSMMQQADVFVAPSVTGSDGDQEGIPVVLMEAMASGIPVISTRHSGIPELVVDGQSGLLVGERDDGALADAISKILLNPALGEELAGAARSRVQDHFNAATQNAQFFRLVQRLHDRALADKQAGDAATEKKISHR
jgi:colanic acid/amylovoran biosynthesis glycosyltransferase